MEIFMTARVEIDGPILRHNSVERIQEMKMNLRTFLAQGFVLGVLLSVAPPGVAADTSSSRTTAKDISKKAGETSRAIKDYTVEQRDEAIKNAKTGLDDLDRRIGRMERKVDRDWDRMDESARKKARATLNALRRQRDEVAEWYGGLKHGSAEAWEEVKSGFVKSYEALKESFAKARKEF
jgi:hypothetical protein